MRLRRGNSSDPMLTTAPAPASLGTCCQFFAGMRIAELRIGMERERDIEATLLLEEAAELRIRASQLAMTAELLISQAEQMSLRAPPLSERAQLLAIPSDTQH